ncbi:MAG: MucB/RseB C-terminal domain-containing protein [Granulosicoccus sp.]
MKRPCLAAALTAVKLATSLAVVLASNSAVHADDSKAQPASESPAALIEAMSNALKTLNYEGTFVHVQGSSVKTMHILHSSDARGELERMRSLDGEAREVIRNDMKVTCIWPASQSVVVSKSKPRELLPSVDASLAHNEAYTIRLAKPDRVAGVATHVVEIQPRDQYRYGYRFWIDQKKRMLLRYMLLNDIDKAVEQIVFTAIDYPDIIEPDRFDVDVENDKVIWVEPAVAATTPSGSSQPGKHDRVGFSELPSGYKKISETYRPMPINDGPVSHAMVSDGMASVSVYVEHVAASDQDVSASGLSTMGALNAYGLSLDAAYVTVVGEVPAATVRIIAESVRLTR